VHAADHAALKQETVDTAERLVGIYPDAPEAWMVMAQMQFRLGDSIAAIESCEKCLTLRPRFPTAHFQIAMIASDQGDHARAERHLRQVIEMDPDAQEARTSLAEALLQSGKTREVVAMLEDRRASGAAEAGRHLLLGQAYLDLGRHDEARRSLEAVVRMAPRYAHTYHGLANAYARLGDAKKAAECRTEYARLKAAEPKSEFKPGSVARDLELMREGAALIHRSAGQVYLEQGDSAEAERQWRRVAELQPQDEQIREALAIFYRQAQRWDDARAAVDELRGLAPENARYAILAGNLAAQRGELAAATAAFAAASKLAPESSAGQAALAQLHLQAGRPPDAAAAAREAIAREPIAQNHFLLGTALQASGDTAGARAAIDRALELDPHNAEYRRARQAMGENP
jgi:tetratricopeptide (TPR) repeat protein